jgi:hypothetical protein
MPPIEARQDRLQYPEFSMNNLRSKVNAGGKTMGKISNETKDYINNAINSFSLTSEYSQCITKLLEQSQNFGVDLASLKSYFEKGLFTTLNLTERLIGSLSKTSTQAMINEFITHCLQTAESFTRMERDKYNKGVFLSIISHSHFYEPQVLENLSTRITDTSYFSTNVLKRLISIGTKQQVMLKESDRFDEFVKNNNIPQSDINHLRVLFLRNNPNPISELAKQKEKRPNKQPERKNFNKTFGKINNPATDEKRLPTERRVQPEPSYVSKLIGDRKRLFEQFSERKHPFLTPENLEYYFKRYNEPKLFILEGIALYNSIQPNYADNSTFRIQIAIEEAIKICTESTEEGIKFYLSMMTSELVKKYEKIPEDNFREIMMSFFIENNFDIDTLKGKLNQEASKHQ